jgi:hypothetical protein
MAVFSIKTFGGISPKVPPRYLQDSQAQIAINCPVFNGPLQPLPDVGAPVVSFGAGDSPRTIYRFGQDDDSDQVYWFRWPRDVDVCRGQIAGDKSEWTFYTGDGIPKATYGEIALQSGIYPSSSIPLGLPAPKAKLEAVPKADFDFTTEYAARVVLDLIALTNMTTDGIEFSLDNEENYTVVSLASLPAVNRAAYVAQQINAAFAVEEGEPLVVATVDQNDVVVETTAKGNGVSLIFRGRRGSKVEYDTKGTFTPGVVSLSAQGNGFSGSVFVVDNEYWSAAARVGAVVSVVASRSTTSGQDVCVQGTVTQDDLPFDTAQKFVDWLNTKVLISNSVTIAAHGTNVVITPGSTHGRSRPNVDGFIYFALDKIQKAEKKARDIAPRDRADPARLFISKTYFESNFRGKFLAYSTNSGTEEKIFIPETATLFSLAVIPGITIDILSADGSAAMVTFGSGTSSTISIKNGTYPTISEFAYFYLYGVGSQNIDSIPETRVYTYTWVSQVANFVFESGPAEPSSPVSVYKDQPVDLSKFEVALAPPATQYIYTARRIYRAVNGIYLFVDEIPATQVDYTDVKKAEELGEEMSSLTWKEPPGTLSGLINLPNGIMAGFVGRDVYFCEPYRPHAWPENYTQTLDFPVVGLGRMDTTLAVLTKGVPYFIQGSHPDSMVVVKSDIQQSCSSKKSIVSVSGNVIYASPDGLVLLSSSGSKVITENMFTQAQWQSFKPESIVAYTQDLKYIAFYDNRVIEDGIVISGERGGFIYDLTTGQFVLHDLYALAGYSDLLRDTLFLCFDDNSLRKWNAGAAKDYVWKSKKFTFPKPISFSCAQVEAETYPLTAKFYVDGLLYHTQIVQSRNEFRLPVFVGRDHEVQFEGNKEVFSFAIAQSVEELQNA